MSVSHTYSTSMLRRSLLGTAFGLTLRGAVPTFFAVALARKPDWMAVQILLGKCDLSLGNRDAARTAFDLDTAGHRVYVVDPTGRIILRYPADAEPRDILKDMERLLRYAWAG